MLGVRNGHSNTVGGSSRPARMRTTVDNHEDWTGRGGPLGSQDSSTCTARAPGRRFHRSVGAQTDSRGRAERAGLRLVRSPARRRRRGGVRSTAGRASGVRTACGASGQTCVAGQADCRLGGRGRGTRRGRHSRRGSLHGDPDTPIRSGDKAIPRLDSGPIMGCRLRNLVLRRDSRRCIRRFSVAT